MKTVLAILIGAIIALCCLVARSDPPPSGDQSQVFSPDELLIIDSYPPVLQESIILRIANGEDVQISGTNAPISKVTGEPLSGFFRKATIVPPEVLALPQYEAGAAWGMTFTSSGTNYFLCRAIAKGYTKPIPPKTVTMKVTFYENLTTNPVATVEGTMDMNTGFMKTEIAQ